MAKTIVNGIELYYEMHGEGEPVAFLNGIMMTVPSWIYQTNVFKKKYRCILHDMRGQLMSAKPAMDYTMEMHVEDFRGLLDILEIDACHIVSTSYGGVVGMLFAASYPDRVKSLSVISSLSHMTQLTAFQIQTWIDVALKCSECFYTVSTVNVFSNFFRESNPEFFAGRGDLFQQLPSDYFEGLARLAKCVQQTNITERLPAVQSPALVMCGEDDILLPLPYSRLIAEKIPGARFLIIPSAGHAVVLEKPEEVNMALLGFIEKYSA